MGLERVPGKGDLISEYPVFKRLWGLLENGLKAFEYQRMVPNQGDPQELSFEMGVK